MVMNIYLDYRFGRNGKKTNDFSLLSTVLRATCRAGLGSYPHAFSIARLKISLYGMFGNIPNHSLFYNCFCTTLKGVRPLDGVDKRAKLMKLQLKMLWRTTLP